MAGEGSPAIGTSVKDLRSKDLHLEEFLGEPTRDLEKWSRLWTSDLDFPIQGGGGLKGWLARVVKRLLRPILRSTLGDLWDRQRVYNLIVLETLVKNRSHSEARFAEHQGVLERLDRRTVEGLQDAMRHNDALFASVDQKLDRYRREAKDLWHRLGALVAAQGGAESADAARPVAASDLAERLDEQSYVAFEQRFRGSEADIAGRVAAYSSYLKGQGDVLDLGCGRGEALEVFAQLGLDARGIDSSAEMVARCQEKGLNAEQGDLFEILRRLPESSLGAICSFHVIEHLPAPAVSTLVRLAWRALRPGGVLILETPSPLALAMSARDFWLDPTHSRPVHPGHLESTYREAGFEPVHRVDLHPYPEAQHLPEINLSTLADDQHQLADHVNRMRDLLDDLLFGNRDFGLVGHKP